MGPQKEKEGKKQVWTEKKETTHRVHPTSAAPSTPFQNILSSPFSSLAATNEKHNLFE